MEEIGEEWCDVKTKRGKKKGNKGEAEKAAVESTKHDDDSAAKKNGRVDQTVQSAVTTSGAETKTETTKQAEVEVAEVAEVRDTAVRPQARWAEAESDEDDVEEWAASRTPAQPDDEWNDVVSKKKKKAGNEGKGSYDGKGRSQGEPWRGQPRNEGKGSYDDKGKKGKDGKGSGKADHVARDSKGKDNKGGKGENKGGKGDSGFRDGAHHRDAGKGESGKGGHNDRFHALRTDASGDQRDNRQRPEQHNNALARDRPPENNSDRFEALRSKSGSESSYSNRQYNNHKGDRSDKGRGKKGKDRDNDQPMTPEEAEKEAQKAKTKREIQDEINACLEGSSLQRTDFDMRARQYLHAIHQKGGRTEVRAALQVLHTSTCQKDRDSVTSWSAYIVTLLKTYHGNLGGKDGDHTPQGASPKLSPALAPASPPKLA